MEIIPITLNGNLIRLEPMCEAHVAGLAQVGFDERIWQHMLYGNIQTEAQMHDWVLDILERQAKGTDLPFVVVMQESGRVAGATRFMEIHTGHRRLEIGGTWYGVEYQRTGVNTEAKYLLLRHAFEVYRCVRVQFKTDQRNERSQRAIERLGAVREGVLRNHMILPDGRLRNSVYYSITDSEWPAVKANLEKKMMR